MSVNQLPMWLSGAISQFATIEVDAIAHGIDADWTQECAPGGLVCVNPVSSRGNTGDWARKCYYSAPRKVSEIGSAVPVPKVPLHVIALVPVKTSSQWFRDYCFPPRSAAICWLDRRVKLVGGKTLDAALIYWGSSPSRFSVELSNVGAVWIRQESMLPGDIVERLGV